MAEAWVWPVPGYTKANTYSGHGYARDTPAPMGTPVIAMRSGTVTTTVTNCTHNYGKPEATVMSYNDPHGAYGNKVYIDHGDGYTSRYAHLTDVYVREGQQVSVGQAIGTVGSTGRSTGPHLHFEIRYQGVAQEPLDFVSPDGSVVVSSDYIPTSTNDYTGSELPASYYGTVEASGTTVGQRVSGLTKQPVHPFVNIYLDEGGTLIPLHEKLGKSHRPNMIQSFEYTRMDGAGEEAIITIFDDDWYDIELTLSHYWDKLVIEYGYPDTGVVSKKVKHRIMSYNISFLSTGTILSLETVTEGVYQNLQTVVLDLNTKDPTLAVKLICKNLGLTVLDENFDQASPINANDNFKLHYDYPITYIQNVIIPQASEENKELFRFYIDENNVAYFKRYSFSSTNTDTLRTYIYQKGYDSVVLDFTVDIKGILAGTSIFSSVTGYKVDTIDPIKKNEETDEFNRRGVITEASGDISHTSSDQSIFVADSAGYTSSQMKSKLYYDLKSHVLDGYSATLTIVGDPTIDFINERYIRVINITDRGGFHHTSGVYWIEGVTDTITGGQMTTSLKLVKNATAGDIDGLEILNPKYIY